MGTRVKNPAAKTRKVNDPYEIWENVIPVFGEPPGTWRWHVLKKYQTPEKEIGNPYARWFTFVTSPIVPSGEYGDTYVKDITSVARLVAVSIKR